MRHGYSPQKNKEPDIILYNLRFSPQYKISPTDRKRNVPWAKYTVSNPFPRENSIRSETPRRHAIFINHSRPRLYTITIQLYIYTYTKCACTAGGARYVTSSFLLFSALARIDTCSSRIARCFNPRPHFVCVYISKYLYVLVHVYTHVPRNVWRISEVLSYSERGDVCMYVCIYTRPPNRKKLRIAARIGRPLGVLGKVMGSATRERRGKNFPLRIPKSKMGERLWWYICTGASVYICGTCSTWEGTHQGCCVSSLLSVFWWV